MTPEEREQLLERVRARLDVPLGVLALLWVGVIVVELAGIVPASLLPYVQSADTAIWAFFLAEFLFELLVAPNKLRYLADNWIIGLSVLLPFFGVLRLVRAVYALRSLALVRIVLGANRATRGVAEILGRGGFQYVAAIVLVAALVGAAAVSFSEALWWSATLVTTINTSLDPVTVEGRIIAYLLRVLGLAVFGYVAGSIASYLVGGEEEEPEGAVKTETLQDIRRQLEEISARLERLERRE
jgi:voltage-gated potassium channel